MDKIEAVARSLALEAGVDPDLVSSRYGSLWSSFVADAQVAIAAHEKWLADNGMQIRPVEPTLDDRMKAAGMSTLSELVNGQSPLGIYSAHAGVKDHDSFEWWLKRRYEEFMGMRMRYELGDREKDDMYEWVFAHAATLNEVLDNWKMMKKRLIDTPKKGYGKTMTELKKSMNSIVSACHTAAREAGWWDGVDIINDVHVVPAKLCLIHSEISEAMEGHRKDLMDDKLPYRQMLEVELADAVIRIADLAGALGLDLGGAIDEKMAFNVTRADHQLENRQAPGGKTY